MDISNITTIRPLPGRGSAIKGLPMEMHQVRYFLAVARELNFTRAAEHCNVAQPSLTRAIKQLEDELGGELFRRERNLSHLTEFGQRMLPLLQQCYDSALSAKELASSFKKGAIAPLSIALSTATDMGLILTELRELVRAFKGLELRFFRGPAHDVVSYLKKGEAEVAVAGPLGETWDRLDAWPLFTEHFKLAVSKLRPIANKKTIAPSNLKDERILLRTYCELDGELQDFLGRHDLQSAIGHKIVSEQDLLTFVEADLGVGIVPDSTQMPDNVVLIPIDTLELKRTIYAYGVAGRQRSPAATALIKLLRAEDWSNYEAA